MTQTLLFYNMPQKKESNRVHQIKQTLWPNKKKKKCPQLPGLNFFRTISCPSQSLLTPAVFNLASSLPLTFSLLSFPITVGALIPSSVLFLPCHMIDLSVSFSLHFSTSPLLLVWAVIQLVSGPVRQPVELICLFRS